MGRRIYAEIELNLNGIEFQPMCMCVRVIYMNDVFVNRCLSTSLSVCNQVCQCVSVCVCVCVLGWFNESNVGPSLCSLSLSLSLSLTFFLSYFLTSRPHLHTNDDFQLFTHKKKKKKKNKRWTLPDFIVFFFLYFFLI